MSDETKKAAIDVDALVNDTEKAAMASEIERLTKELAEVKEKQSGPTRKAKRHDPGTEIPKGYGKYNVSLSAKGKGDRPGAVLFEDVILATDESDALRQAMIELCDQQGWPQPPEMIRGVEPTEATAREREDRLKFRKWRSANQKREDRGEPLLPLPANLEQFRGDLTDTEELATSRQLATAQ